MELSSQERRRRECGWRVSVPVSQQRIPSLNQDNNNSYNSSYDNEWDKLTSTSTNGTNMMNSNSGNGNSNNRGARSRRGTRNRTTNNNNNNGNKKHNKRNNKSRGNSNTGKSSTVSKTIFRELQRKRMGRGKQDVMQSPNRALSGLTSSNPGPSFDFAPAHFRVDSVARDKATKHAELEVLKLVLIREGYVRRLNDVARQIIDGDRTILRAAGGTFIVDLLVQTRASSLAVVRAVVDWRNTLTRKLIQRLYKSSKVTAMNDLSKKSQNDIALARCEPFVWNGINYLLKMCHDTDFLAGTQPLVQALGVREDNMIHNPLMMPDGLDACPRPSKQQRIQIQDSIGQEIPSTPLKGSTKKISSPGPETTSPTNNAISNNDNNSNNTETTNNPAKDATQTVPATTQSSSSQPLSSSQPPPSQPSQSQQPQLSSTKRSPSSTTEEEVLKLAWVLLAEERQARKVMRREAKWNEEQRGRRGDREDDYEQDDYEQEEGSNQKRRRNNKKSIPNTDNNNDPNDKNQNSNNLKLQNNVEEEEEEEEDEMNGLNPSLSQSPLRKGNERLDTRSPPRSRGTSRNGRRNNTTGGLNDMRPVLAWHEKARLLMQRWEREMAVSAWPTDASTGRMSPMKRSNTRGRSRGGRNRRLGPLTASTSGSQRSSRGQRSQTPLLSTPMWGNNDNGGSGGLNNGQQKVNIPNFPHGGNARSLPTLNGRQSPQRAYGRPLTKKSKSQKRAARNPHTIKNNTTNDGANGEDGVDEAMSRSNLVNLASMTRPPPAVVLVSATVMILLSPGETVPEDLMWSSLRREIADTDVFLRR